MSKTLAFPSRVPLLWMTMYFHLPLRTGARSIAARFEALR
jgi:hypothetical protein